MALGFSYYLLPLVASAVISAILAVFVFINREKRTGPQILGILVAALIWSTAEAFMIANTDLASKLFWHDVRFIGSTLVVLSVFLHAVEYTGREELITRRSVLGLSSVFVVTVVLAWTEGALGHDLIRTNAELVQQGPLTVVSFEFGPWFFLNAVYSYLLLTGAAGMYIAEIVNRSGTYRIQTLGLFIGLSVPWILNGVYLAGFSVIDLTPFGFTVMGAIFVAGFYRYQLLDVVPIARSTVINHIENGYLVIDDQDNIVDANERCAKILETPRDDLIGARLDSQFAEYPKALEKFGTEREIRDDISLEVDGTVRDFDVEISPVYDGHDRYVGRVVLIRDVTEDRRKQRKLEERTAELERQNEKLDQFAGIVSHDLRNPIAVAKGHLQIAEEDGDEASFERVRESLERMEEITDDVLALARQDSAMESVESVDLARLCERAWRTAETDQATLVVDTTRTIRADSGRLRRALENLFRNSVEHGPADVTIRVGDLPDGFYVEDDGPGIPDEIRGDVLELGYTTADQGTGFGLTIVAETANVHGWSLNLTEGEDGGARFEFTAVEEATDSETPTDSTAA